MKQIAHMGSRWPLLGGMVLREELFPSTPGCLPQAVVLLANRWHLIEVVVCTGPCSILQGA